jgi:uncharacterized membrane protein
MRLIMQRFQVPAVAAMAALVVSWAQPATSDETGGRPTVTTAQTYSYSRDVKPIIEQKCVACHACYDAPCQLILTSAQGLLA